MVKLAVRFQFPMREYLRGLYARRLKRRPRGLFEIVISIPGGDVARLRARNSAKASKIGSRAPRSRRRTQGAPQLALGRGQLLRRDGS